MNLHWAVITTQSPQLTSGFILGGAHSVDFDRCIMTCVHHCSNIQNSFIALKIFTYSSAYPHLHRKPLISLLFLYLFFPGMSYSEDRFLMLYFRNMNKKTWLCRLINIKIPYEMLIFCIFLRSPEYKQIILDLEGKAAHLYSYQINQQTHFQRNIVCSRILQ